VQENIIIIIIINVVGHQLEALVQYWKKQNHFKLQLLRGEGGEEGKCVIMEKIIPGLA